LPVATGYTKNETNFMHGQISLLNNFKK